MIKKTLFSLFLGLLCVLTFSELGYAQEMNDVAENIVDSAMSLPGLLAAFAYLSGLIVGVSAIFKTVDHVSNPTQTLISVPVIRFLLAGGLFALPIIAETVVTTINGGTTGSFDPSTEAYTYFSSILGELSALISLGTNFNGVMKQVVEANAYMPALISAVAYLLGLVIMVSALYKTRDHVENPSQVPLKDAVIRYLTAGALFALPTLYNAMYTTIASTGLGAGGTITSIVAMTNFVNSTETTGLMSETLDVDCATIALPLGSTVGDVICSSMINLSALPTFLNAIAYVLGLVFGVWGVLKIRDHVLEPSKVGLSEGVTRLIAGGAFFALPYLIIVFYSTFTPAFMTEALVATGTNTGFASKFTCSEANSLDEAMGCFMADILGPTHVVLNFFSFVAGMIFIMIGISRLIKSAQEGPKGPGGLGTFGTFVIGGMLLSATTILRAFSGSLFTSPITYTYASLQYTTGMSASEQQAALNVISAVLQFLIIIGMISFVRGMFIMRDVTEGKQGASTMAGITHLVAGALAVNMGPLLNAIQQTLGITAFGVEFG